VNWAINQACYKAMFVKVDTDQDGFVNGLEIKHAFLSCNLAQSVLANIWYVAPITGFCSYSPFPLVVGKKIVSCVVGTVI
jgi:hypothetical protein